MPELGWDRGALLFWIVAGLALERCLELALSHRNLTRLRASRTPHAASSGGGEYAAMVATHALFLGCPLLEYEHFGTSGPPWLALCAAAAIAAAQALRWWTIRTLGLRWNARAVVAPSLGAVLAGPYRFLRHPNYLAVIVEFAALPCVAGTWRSGSVLFALNLLLLARRVRQEEHLLASVPGWSERFAR